TKPSVLHLSAQSSPIGLPSITPPLPGRCWPMNPIPKPGGDTFASSVLTSCASAAPSWPPDAWNSAAIASTTMTLSNSTNLSKRPSINASMPLSLKHSSLLPSARPQPKHPLMPHLQVHSCSAMLQVHSYCYPSKCTQL